MAHVHHGPSLRALSKVHLLEGPGCSGRERIRGGCPHPDRLVVPTREEEVLPGDEEGVQVAHESLVPIQRRHLSGQMWAGGNLGFALVGMC